MANHTMATQNRTLTVLEQSVSSKYCFCNYKLLFASLLSVTVIIIVCSMFTNDQVNVYRLTTVLQGHFDLSDKLATLLLSTQRERGMSCTFLGSKNKSSKIKALLNELREDTDKAVTMLMPYQFSDSYANANEIFVLLQQHRLNVSQKSIGCSDTIEFFTTLNRNILAMLGNARFGNNNVGQLWLYAEVYDLVLNARELTGIIRASGVPFFTDGAYSKKQLSRFNELLTQFDMLIQMAKSKSSEYNLLYESIVLGDNENYQTLQLMIEEIRQNRTSGSSEDLALAWVRIITRHIDRIKESEQILKNWIDAHLMRQRRSSFTNLIVSCCLGLIAVLVCPPLTYFFSYQNAKTITASMLAVSVKTQEVEAARKKADELLEQILPTSVAQALKNGTPVKPELFESVSILFSDVVGFTALVSDSTPFETINLLNTLYENLDNVVEHYDVYKVETIGDAYMVASGLPVKNGMKHAFEICHYALDVGACMFQFFVPHKPNQRIQLRTGIHSGPCAAGIVGIKRPRYCLFGDTVNVASRMESSGYADRIQISHTTKRIIENDSRFLFSYRGYVKIKGKGDMETFWLCDQMSQVLLINEIDG